MISSCSAATRGRQEGTHIKAVLDRNSHPSSMSHDQKQHPKPRPRVPSGPSPHPTPAPTPAPSDPRRPSPTTMPKLQAHCPQAYLASIAVDRLLCSLHSRRFFDTLFDAQLFNLRLNTPHRAHTSSFAATAHSGAPYNLLEGSGKDAVSTGMSYGSRRCHKLISTQTARSGCAHAPLPSQPSGKQL